jgi:hypothetical protein
MPEDLLQELEAAAPVPGSLESVEDLGREAMTHATQIGLAVQGLRGSALAFENIWRRIIMHVGKGQAAEMHAGRQGLLNVFEKRLSLLKQTHALATWLRKLGSADVPDPDVLLPEIAGMERLKAGVFDRWQTAPDLEDLAARDYPLSTADLDRIGPNRRPPASFYTEQSKPF